MPLRAHLGRLGPFVLACGVGAIALQQTWFLCDDAFIAFRYVGNAHDGHGLVWNEAPWQPVEGYSSFLWAVLLLVTWQLTGVAPPECANVLAVACGLVSLGLVARRLNVLPLSERLAPHRPVLAALVLVAIASSHSWITWQTSGLDAALFGMLAVGWTLAATAPRDAGEAPSLMRMAGWAAAAQLARPDGALLILATLGLAVFAVLRERTRVRATLLALWPFVFVAAHLAWRRSFYGEWVPNTYFAKVVEPWPESGLRYLGCFVFEHGVWLWLPVAIVWALRFGGASGRWRALPAHAPAVFAVATWLVYVGYYTLRVGGDHFGYRPFMHLLPLAGVALLVFARDLRQGLRATLAALAVFGVAGNSFGWWYETRLRGREGEGFVAVADELPPVLRPLWRWYDRQQAWLRLHLVGIRRPQHASLCASLARAYPPRATPIANQPTGQRGVIAFGAAGVASWRLSQCDVIDIFGLNDWVVARNPLLRRPGRLPQATLAEFFRNFDKNGDGRLQSSELEAFSLIGDQTLLSLRPATWASLLTAAWDVGDDGIDRAEFDRALVEITDGRLMAHERQPPAGYSEALRPNVRWIERAFEWQANVRPITAAEIVAVEKEWRARLGR